MGQWRVLQTTLNEVNLDLILGSGQSFRWFKNGSGVWIGVFSDSVWHLKQEDDGRIKYFANSPTSCNTGKTVKRLKSFGGNGIAHTDSQPDDYEKSLRNYLQLDVSVQLLYTKWTTGNLKFKLVADRFPGIRILRQDPVENLFSFICSTNNNISRITSMIDKLCTNFGTPLLEDNGVLYYSFPTISSLASDEVEEKLRLLGFGYRAKFISQTAQFLHKNMSADWLHSLREMEYFGAHDALQQLPGVGAKVADCVCLMSLNKPQAVPIDTHVWKVTTSHYLPHLRKSKTLTTKIYREVGDYFREQFGDYAGWAQSVLFCSDLKKLQNETAENT